MLQSSDISLWFSLTKFLVGLVSVMFMLHSNCSFLDEFQMYQPNIFYV
jgi:hypothetical protein